MFAIIGPVQVPDLNAQANAIVSGVASPTAVAGFAHKIERDLKEGGLPCTVSGAALIVHKASLLDGHPKLAPTGSDLRKGKGGASILDEIKGRATLSLVLAIDLQTNVPKEDRADIAQEIALSLRERIPGYQFAGGRVHLIKDAARPVVMADEEEGLRAQLRRLPGGSVLQDRRDLLESIIATGRDPLDAILDVVERLSVAPKDEKGSLAYVRRHAGWLVPIAVGFQAIEPPRERRTARVPAGTYPHSYAACLTSIGEFKSLRSLLSHDKDVLDRSLWRHHHSPETGTYYVSATGSI